MLSAQLGLPEAGHQVCCFDRFGKGRIVPERMRQSVEHDEARIDPGT